MTHGKLDMSCLHPNYTLIESKNYVMERMEILKHPR
jgi:hypothetical protein